MQSKKDSVIEAFQNIAFGMFVAFLAQIVWFPLIGKEFSLLDNVATTILFTAISFLRQYGLRRYHNAKLKKELS